MTKLVSMKEGSIVKNIILFTLPILLGNLFQIFYNTVDSSIVGRYVGYGALAAVGASTPLINFLVGLFMGIATGASVLVSRYFGAGKKEELSVVVHTFIKFTLIFGVFMTFIGVFSSAYLLAAFNTPADIIQDATIYLQVYFAGIMALMLYNVGAGILRAIGDSKRPLYFLMLSSIINIILDLVFVVNFNMGVLGVAIATLIAQTVSTILVAIVLMKENDFCVVKVNKLVIDKVMLKQIMAIGLPAGLQQSIVSLSNLMVQGYINSFGSYAIAGYSAGSKLDSFLVLPINSLALTMTTFVGQNSGANNPKRATKGINYSLIIMTICVLFIGYFAYTNLDFFIGLFNDDPDVVKYGVMKMQTLIPFYVILGINQILIGGIRGFGVTKIPVIINIFAFCIVRQAYLYISFNLFKDIYFVFYSYAFTWIISAILIVCYYYIERKRIINHV